MCRLEFILPANEFQFHFDFMNYFSGHVSPSHCFACKITEIDNIFLTYESCSFDGLILYVSFFILLILYLVLKRMDWLVFSKVNTQFVFNKLIVKILKFTVNSLELQFANRQKIMMILFLTSTYSLSDITSWYTK